MGLALVLALWLRLPALALAHAKLTESSPTAGVVLDSSPGKVEMMFSEGVSLQFSTIKLLDRSRKELPVGPPTSASGNNTAISATLPASLPTGTYTVVWRVLSANDGHVTTSNFAFKVRGKDANNGSTAGSAGATTEAATQEPESTT